MATDAAMKTLMMLITSTPKTELPSSAREIGIDQEAEIEIVDGDADLGREIRGDRNLGAIVPIEIEVREEKEPKRELKRKNARGSGREKRKEKGNERKSEHCATLRTIEM